MIIGGIRAFIHGML